MIERKNIIKLLSDRSNVYHSAFLTTYNFDPIFFESVYLSILRKLGITNVVVLMDASMYDQLVADNNYQYHRVTPNNYTLVRQENTHSGVFHSKMALLFGEEEGALILGSGNLTYSGLSNNEEVWNAFHIKGNESIHYPLFYKAWKYLTSITASASPLVKRQIDWMEEQCHWLQKESNREVVILNSDEECRLLYNSPNSTILSSVFTAIEEKEIDEITVIAPFYDTEGYALKKLQRVFSPKSMRCVLDLDRKSAPYSLLQNETSIDYYKSTSSNPLHAKIIELQGKDETWILCGSANAGNMALGTNTSIFNDEACIFLHNKKKRNYIKELGISFSSITPEEKKLIVRPEQRETSRQSLAVKIIACDEKENNIYLRFNKPGIEGNLTLLDKTQHVLFSSYITTKENVSLDVDNTDISALHIAVLKENNIEISNRILVIREIYVERCNPDPKRRKLSSLLDDTDLLNNLNHILGYIEFEDTDNKAKQSRNVKAIDNNDNEEDAVVTQDRFDKLKDSTLSINMHSGVRILAYLQQVLFKKEEDDETDDKLLELDEEKEDNETNGNDNKINRAQSNIDKASILMRDIVCFLKKMQNHLIEKTYDDRIHDKRNHLPKHPKLMATPGLNAASSIAVAARAVICLMNKYGPYITKIKEVKDLLVKNAGVFLSLYSNMLPSDDSIRNRKTLELLKDATVDLFSALCFFSYSKDDFSMPQLVLNSLEMWKKRNEINDIMPLFEEQLLKLNPNSLKDDTISTIRHISNIYLSQETPIREFSANYSKIFQLKSGYGFLVIDNIKRTNDSWCYLCHSPWFEEKIENVKFTKYKGYYEI